MRRVLLVASVFTAFAIACSAEERPKGAVAPETDTGFPITESGVDTAVTPTDSNVADTTTDSGTPADTSMADAADTSVPDVSGDGTITDISSTRDTEIDAIKFEAGAPDTAPDTALPDVFGLSDTRIDVDPDAPVPPG